MIRVLTEEDFQDMVELFNSTYPNHTLKGKIRSLWWKQLSLMDGQAVKFAFEACIGDETYAFRYGKVVQKARDWLKSHRSTEERHSKVLPKHQPFPDWLLKTKAIEQSYKAGTIEYDEFAYKWTDCWRENEEVYNYREEIVVDHNTGKKRIASMKASIAKRLAEIKIYVETKKKPEGDVSYGLNFGDIPDNRKKELV